MRKQVVKTMGVLAIVGLITVIAIPGTTQGKSVADELAVALNSYTNLEFDKGLEIASGLLQRSDLTAIDSVAIFETLSIINYAMGEAFYEKSIEYLNKISAVGPCVSRLPQKLWPQELRDKWYKILHARNQLTCDTDGEEGPMTIAIMEFDNHSVGEYQEKLGSLAKGLADFFQLDFAKISSLKVIERDKIDFVLKEIALQQSGSVDKASAVKVGKILGAKLMVFGTIMQLDHRQTRMAVRVVDVETSEIVASVDEEGNPDYNKIEKKLVKALAAQLDVKVDKETEAAIDLVGTESMDATTFYSIGLEAMDRYDYKSAFDNFKKAYELDNSFEEAKRKMEVYRPLVG